MALDRPATVRIVAAGTRNEHGEYVPGGRRPTIASG